MTNFTLGEYIDNKLIQEKDGSVTINVEPIPFAGMVAIQDQEDRELMLREQLHVVQAECQRLQGLLRKNGIEY